MKTDALRSAYLDFFKSKNHTVFSSDSLVPANDPSLLFTGAGMNQFKPYFLGLKKDVQRATSCQKCLRTADLDRVGKTAYHHSFFEMLGNFSFGDYFKEEAIEWGWEFVTKALAFPKHKLWVSVYEEDDEAFELWKKKIGVPESRIVRMGAVDNFWPSNAVIDGPNGPCGPCSEIYVGETPGKGVEIWNLVFTQFDRQSDGTLKNLPQKNIDTGMGLERTAAVLQGVESNFDTDNFVKIRQELRQFVNNSKRIKDEKEAVSRENAVMDHIRAVVFSIADGALPSNDGRGYVIRKIIRLGSEHFEKVGADSGSFHRLTPVIVEVMKAVYPDLVSREKNITMIIENEERSYQEVIKTRIPALKNELPSSRNAAETAFKYYDTYGLPFELIQTTAAQLGVKIDAELFNNFLQEQKKRSRESSKIAGEIFANKSDFIAIEGLPNTIFLGYEKTQGTGKILRMLKGKDFAQSLSAGDEAAIICDQTPFYAESGGQIGNTGAISAHGLLAHVIDTQWIEKCAIHKVKVISGEIKAGTTVDLKVDHERRADIMKNHTATHLLHAALRKILGDHVKQSGSLVAPDRLRFDFTHFSALDAKSLNAIESLVNDEIHKNTRLTKKAMPKEQAVKEGAIAFFGEKYGDEVRVVSVGEFSKELCGGTHLNSTGEIELFKIVSEGSIQAGVRRLEAVTGRGAKELLRKQDEEIQGMARSFQLDAPTLPNGLRQKIAQISAIKSRLAGSLNTKIIDKVSDDLQKAQNISGVKFLNIRMTGADNESLKFACDYLKNSKASFAAFFSSHSADKISLVVAASEDIVKKGFNSGKIVKEVSAVVEGNGGGRPDFAVGGGKNIAKMDEALKFGEKMIREALAS